MVALAEAKGFVARHALRLAYLAEVSSLEGQLEEATRLAREGIRLARLHGERGNEAYALRAAGEIAVRRGDMAAAEQALVSALDIAEELGLRPLLAHCHRGLARPARDDDSDRRSAHAKVAAQFARDMGMHFWTRHLEPVSVW